MLRSPVLKPIHETRTLLVIDDDRMLLEFEVQVCCGPGRFGKLGKPFTSDHPSHKVRTLLTHVA